MKTNSIIVLVAVAGVLALAGCAKEAETGSGEGLPMRVVPSIAGETKAGMQMADLTEFYLQVKSSNPKYSYFEKFSKSGSEWSSGERMLWESNTASVTCSAAYFEGHSFTKEEFADGVELSVPADQSTESALKSADLLSISARTVKFTDTNDGAMTVELSHGFSKVNFVLSLAEVYYFLNVSRSDNPVKQFKVKNVNAGFTFKSGSVTVKTGTQNDIIPFAGDYTPSTSANKTATAIYEAIMAPQTFAAGELEVSFRIVESDLHWTDFTWTNTSAITLEPGKTHVLPLSATRPAPYNGHAFVNMGTGLKWATCNVGANHPWEYGDYFAWGETETKDRYKWSTYKWGSGSPFTKYTSLDMTLEPADDAATANWGAGWRMPTVEEWDWLRENCTWVLTDNYNGKGVTGMIVTSTVNGNQIFLPAAGNWSDSAGDVGFSGFYWTSTIGKTNTSTAEDVTFYNGVVLWGRSYRYSGQSVRPVTK